MPPKSKLYQRNKASLAAAGNLAAAEQIVSDAIEAADNFDSDDERDIKAVEQYRRFVQEGAASSKSPTQLRPRSQQSLSNASAASKPASPVGRQSPPPLQRSRSAILEPSMIGNVEAQLNLITGAFKNFFTEGKKALMESGLPLFQTKWDDANLSILVSKWGAGKPTPLEDVVLAVTDKNLAAMKNHKDSAAGLAINIFCAKYLLKIAEEFKKLPEDKDQHSLQQKLNLLNDFLEQGKAEYQQNRQQAEMLAARRIADDAAKADAELLRAVREDAAQQAAAIQEAQARAQYQLQAQAIIPAPAVMARAASPQPQPQPQQQLAAAGGALPGVNPSPQREDLKTFSGLAYKNHVPKKNFVGKSGIKTDNLFKDLKKLAKEPENNLGQQIYFLYADKEGDIEAIGISDKGKYFEKKRLEGEGVINNDVTDNSKTKDRIKGFLNEFFQHEKSLEGSLLANAAGGKGSRS